MRTPFLFLLCFQVIHADWLLDLMEEYTDDNIDPCDDFYKHTCGNTKEWTIDIIEKRYQEDIQDYEKGDTSGFDEIFSPLENSHSLHQTNANRFKKKICNYTNNFMPSFRNFIGSQEDCLSYNYYSTEKGKEIIEIVANNIQFISWTNEYKLQEKMKEVYRLLTELIREEVKATSWFDTYNLKENILKRLDSYSLLDMNSGMENHFLKFGPVLLKECLSYNESLEYCFNVICGIYSQKYGLQLKSRGKFNAVYNYFGTHITMFGPLYDLIYNKSSFTMFALMNVMAHELGHLVFYNFMSGGTVTESSSIKCVHDAMNDVCELFTNGTENEYYCGNKTKTINEDIADFMEIMLTEKLIEYSYRSHLKSTKKVVDNDMAKKLLKSQAIAWCGLDHISLEDDHSSGYHRVNMIAKQSKVFQETYKCKPGDRMYASHENLCIVTGKEAPSTKTFLEEVIYSHV